MLLIEEVAMVQRGHTSPLVPKGPPKVNVNSMTQLLYRLDMTKAARRIAPRPLLLVHCQGDKVVPVHISKQLYDAVQEPKALWLIPGGDHSVAQHDSNTSERVLEWLAMSRPSTENLKVEDLPDD